MRRLALLAVLLLTTPILAADDETSALTDLDDVRLGEQVAGARVLPQDLEGRVVLLYHWCVSCPISTGTFPYVNQLVAKYRDRGLLVVGLQVRRSPDVPENDVVWYLEHLRPDFPVFRLGWNREWPASYLPWGVLFDHEGNEAFAGNLRGIEDAIEKALDDAPHPVLGGPYEKLADLAHRLATEPDRLGRNLAEVRRLSAGDDPAHDEASALLAAVESWRDLRIERAGEALESPVEREEEFDTLARVLDGDSLAARPREIRDALRSAPSFDAERLAETALREARRRFRRLPPPGHYIYHFTEMPYEVSDDPVRIATRVRMVAEFRIALDRIVETASDTHAASVASDLLFEHEVPELDEAGAKRRLARAEKLLAGETDPVGLYEAHLALYEIHEAYLEMDATAKRADALLATLRKERADALATAAAALRELEREAERILAAIRSGGSLFPRERADALAAELEAVAERAGRGSVLGRQAAAEIARLRASYEGPAHVGVGLDGRFAGPGARLARVYPGTGAAKAGLVAGDVVLELAGKELADASGFAAALEGRKPGETVKARVRRASGEVETVEILLGRRP